MFVRSSESYSNAPRRRGLTFIAIVIALIYLFLTGISTIWTDFLWFESVGFESVWQTNLLTSVVLGAIGIVVVFAVIWGNLLLTDRISPRMELLDLGEDEEMIERFRDWVEPRLRFVRLGVAAVFALLLGLGVTAWRDEVLLFLNPVSFGQADPQFGADLGFYMFRLPFWELLTSWLFNLGVLALILSATVHYLNGGIRLRQGTRLSMRPGAKAHLSAIAAALAAIRAVGYWIDSRELLYAGQSSFFGAGYTDINARLPALQLLAIVSVLAAVLFLWNIRRPDWTLAIVSVGAWAFVSVAAGLVYPAIIQRFTVQPNELARESEFIALNVAATRDAFGLDHVEVRPFEADRSLTREDIEANRLTVDNLRLWDPAVLTRTYQSLQEIRAYYRVDSVDTDRYVIEGQPTQVLVSARELDENSESIPTDWQNQVLSYTHGFGAVLSPANSVESDGQPSLYVRDIPPISDFPELELDQSRIYFGESYDPEKPVIVKTGDSPQEVDLPVGQLNNFNEYDGAAGVEVGSFLRRLAFGLRYRDLNMLISSQLRDDSRILQVRNIETMVEEVAPFLRTDADPYPVFVDGRVMWVLDLYTISDKYPYSQPVTTNDTLRLAQSSGLPRVGFNYIRNSVKASIDAFDGTIKLYIVDPTDPLITAWQGVYPELFTDEPVPEALEDHFRYPQDLFKIQSEKYLDYHVVETGDFFRRSDSWSIPRDPSTVERSGRSLLWGDGLTADGRTALLDRFLPNYLLVNLPGEEDLSYVLMQPFTPQNRVNMASFLVGDATPGRYGRLIDYRLPTGTLVEGTGQVGDRINQDSDIAQQLTLWDQEGSNVLFGDMLVVPIEESILYVMPVYLAAEAGGGLPEFRRVITVFGDTIQWDDTLEGALDLVFGEDESEDDEGEDGEPGDLPETEDGRTIEELLADASARFEEARAALRSGDLAEYQRLFEEAEDLVNRALELVVPSVDAALRVASQAERAAGQVQDHALDGPMTAPLWIPSADRVADTTIERFRRAVAEAHGLDLPDTDALHAWSVADPATFWSEVWERAGVIGDKGSEALRRGAEMPDAEFFPEGRLSVVENLLHGRGASDDAPAIEYRREDGVHRTISWAEMRAETAAFGAALAAMGVTAGDRVAAWMPHMAETVIAMLGAASIGAVFTSTSADFGTAGVVDRFGQVEPKVLVVADGYLYGGKAYDRMDQLTEILDRLPSVEATVVVPNLGNPEVAPVKGGVLWEAFVGPHRGAVLSLERFPFDHPHYILYSSGTTGKPKCMVHKTGGVLLKHMQEQQHHLDIRPGDRVFYFTTCGWMMWNWLVSCLATGATIVLFDGNPFHPGPAALFDLVDELDVTLLGVSAKYIDAVLKSGLRPIDSHRLTGLRTIASTGSPLSPDGFAFVYEGIKADVHLASISGGTDLCGCFVGGDPTKAVYPGEIQAKALGMAVEVFDDDGKPLGPGEQGELVCTEPFPSMPITFWGEDGDARYRAAYYARFPGVWTHGDYAMWTERGGMVILGRSDATLNASGVRIGTAEIYRVVEQFPEVLEAVAVAQRQGSDTRVVLFVRMADGSELTSDLEAEIRDRLRSEESPRHVPSIIAAVEDIPRTRSGKISELAVTAVVNGDPVKNTEALANPEALDMYRSREELSAP